MRARLLSFALLLFSQASSPSAISSSSQKIDRETRDRVRKSDARYRIKYNKYVCMRSYENRPSTRARLINRAYNDAVSRENSFFTRVTHRVLGESDARAEDTRQSTRQKTSVYTLYVFAFLLFA